VSKTQQAGHRRWASRTTSPVGKTAWTGPTCPHRCCAQQRRLPESWKVARQQKTTKRLSSDQGDWKKLLLHGSSFRQGLQESGIY